jgi:hypothetical protein
MSKSVEVTTAQIIEARGWIADQQWGDLEPKRVAQLSRGAVVKGIERFYPGGWNAFVAECCTSVQV